MKGDEIREQTCKECYLFNTEYCFPDGLVPFDATTCKTYHTKESFESLINSNKLAYDTFASDMLDKMNNYNYKAVPVTFYGTRSFINWLKKNYDNIGVL